jgi:hypothetical protein
MFKVSGTVKRISTEQIVSEKFKKREFVLTIPDGEKWVQEVQFEFVQNNCSFLNNYSEGMKVEVNFNLKGREWISPQNEKRYFNTLQAYAIKEQGDQPVRTTPNTQAHWSGLRGEMAQDHVDQGLSNMLDDDDLPF